MNPDLDLKLDRIIRAPRSVVWDAWTDPGSLASWWLPAPTRCRVERLDTVPGGAFVTSMSDDGIEFVPHLDACFLAVEGDELREREPHRDAPCRSTSPASCLVTVPHPSRKPSCSWRARDTGSPWRTTTR